MTRPSLSLLSRLWLAEPDAQALALAREAGLPASGDLAALAAAWTDLFLLNVHPYGTAFTDLSGELNGPDAAAALARYEAAGFDPPELASAGAPDHAGLCLGYLAHLEAHGLNDPDFLGRTLHWIPVCALAVERQPSVHRFYREMAAATREALLARASGSSAPSVGPDAPPPPGDSDEEELGLSRVVSFLLAPAACGFFLSRARMGELALEAGTRVPFGSRREVARSLFESAGEHAGVGPLLSALAAEADSWDADYARLAREHPGWEGRALAWRGRIATARELLAEMGRILDSPLEVEYGRAEQD